MNKVKLHYYCVLNMWLFKPNRDLHKLPIVLIAVVDILESDIKFTQYKVDPLHAQTNYCGMGKVSLERTNSTCYYSYCSFSNYTFNSATSFIPNTSTVPPQAGEDHLISELYTAKSFTLSWRCKEAKLTKWLHVELCMASNTSNKHLIKKTPNYHLNVLESKSITLFIPIQWCS